ncbi:MAG: FeoB-associated Cys-rich membrane protein [Oscillospiraceae bacterium]|nr:FeoB-associated Cys-rich membrane protein [Oscillospiraceae bacterium]
MKWIVLLAVIAIFVLIVVHELKKRKSGGGCSCGCSDCGMKDMCHKDSHR